MKQIKLLFLLASASVTGVFAQSNGLTDMSQSRYAKMANTGINAVHWTNGFWENVLMYLAGLPCRACGIPGIRRKFLMVSVILRLLPVYAKENIGDLHFMMETCISGWKGLLLCMQSIKIRNWTS